MTDDEVEAKLRRMVEPRLGKAKADRILETCWRLEKLSSPAELVRLVA
jgi:2-methylcitrate dehydratase